MRQLFLYLPLQSLTTISNIFFSPVSLTIDIVRMVLEPKRTALSLAKTFYQKQYACKNGIVHAFKQGLKKIKVTRELDKKMKKTLSKCKTNEKKARVKQRFDLLKTKIDYIYV